MSKLIIDTNVLIYGLDTDSGFHTSAVNILTSSDYELFVPTKVISEFFAVASKLSVPTTIAFQFYREVQENTTLVFPNLISLGYFEQLIQKYQPRGNRVFDLEIVSVAMGHDIPEIATANLNDFQGIDEIITLAIVEK